MPQVGIEALTSALMGALGLAVGVAVAEIGLRLPREDDGPAEPLRLQSLASRRHLLLALVGAAIGVWAALSGGAHGLVIGATALLGWQLLLIAVIDAEHFWLPDRLTLPLIGTGLIAGAVMVHGLPWVQVVGAVVGFGGLWLVAFLYRRVRGRDGLGGGDPFLFAGAGAWVGWTGLPGVLLSACAVGFCVVMLRLLLRRPVRATDRLPFGTYLAAGVWLTWLVSLSGR